MGYKNRYHPNYLKLCPELVNRPDIIEALKHTDRQMEYAEYDRKQERFIYDSEKMVAKFLPSAEDSLERMQEENQLQFADVTDVEGEVLQQDDFFRLHSVLNQLDDQERGLIEAIYFQEKSEREYAQISKLPHMTVHDKKVRILKKLKKILED